MGQIKLLKPIEVADILKVHIKSVQKMCHDGKLPSVRVGKLYRISEDDLKKWIRDNHNNGKK